MKQVAALAMFMIVPETALRPRAAQRDGAMAPPPQFVSRDLRGLAKKCRRHLFCAVWSARATPEILDLVSELLNIVIAISLGNDGEFGLGKSRNP